jgi:hypothetical protein
MILSTESTAAFHSGLIPTPRHETLGPTAPRKLGAYVAVVLAKVKDLAPYAAIELILPGGSLVALVLWFYRRRRSFTERAPVVASPPPPGVPYRE